MQELFGQITSVVGMILTIASFQMRTRRSIIIFQTMGSSFFLVSYFLLGSWTGVYMNIVYLTRNFVFYYRNEKQWAKSKCWLGIFLVASVVAGALGYRRAIDILPIFGAVFATLAMYMPRENMLRAFNLLASPCWLVYNIQLPSTGGILCETFNMVSIAVGLFRYRKDGIFRKKSTV